LIAFSQFVNAGRIHHTAPQFWRMVASEVHQLQVDNAVTLAIAGDAVGASTHFMTPAQVAAAFPTPPGVEGIAAVPAHHPAPPPMIVGAADDIIGGTILRGRRERWCGGAQGQQQPHPHAGMPVGASTLTGYCLRILCRGLGRSNGRYVHADAVRDYMAALTAEPYMCRDSYAAPAHIRFFGNRAAGRDPLVDCAAEPNADVAALVGVGPIVAAELLRGGSCADATAAAMAHVSMLYLAGPVLRAAVATYAGLIAALLAGAAPAAQLLRDAAPRVRDVLSRRMGDAESLQLLRADQAAAGPLDDALYFACRYIDAPAEGLVASASAGGESCGRGAVVGFLLGLAQTAPGPCNAIFCALHEPHSVRADARAVSGFDPSMPRALPGGASRNRAEFLLSLGLTPEDITAVPTLLTGASTLDDRHPVIDDTFIRTADLVAADPLGSPSAAYRGSAHDAQLQRFRDQRHVEPRVNASTISSRGGLQDAARTLGHTGQDYRSRLMQQYRDKKHLGLTTVVPEPSAG
jgi:hypothetical protein